jgi:hypothetical protein
VEARINAAAPATLTTGGVVRQVRRAVPCRAVPCCALLCRAVLCRAALCRAVPWHTSRPAPTRNIGFPAETSSSPSTPPVPQVSLNPPPPPQFASFMVRDTPAPAPDALLSPIEAADALMSRTGSITLTRCSLIKPRVVVAKGDDAPLPSPPATERATAPGRRARLPRMSCDSALSSPVFVAAAAAGPMALESAARASCECASGGELSSLPDLTLTAGQRVRARLNALSDMGHSCEVSGDSFDAADAAAGEADAAVPTQCASPKLHRRPSRSSRASTRLQAAPTPKKEGKRASGEGKGAAGGRLLAPMPSSAGAGAMLMASMMAADAPSTHARSSMPSPSTSLLSSLAPAGDASDGHAYAPPLSPARLSMPLSLKDAVRQSVRQSLPSMLRGGGGSTPPGALVDLDRRHSLHTDPKKAVPTVKLAF